METKTFWWLKSSKSDTHLSKALEVDSTSRTVEEEISSSLAEFIEKEKNLELVPVDRDVDIGSIIEEINRLAAQSPLGPYENDVADRSVEDIMREAEKIYMESSKSFEQLSVHSRTSQNITDVLNSESSSTPTPKSISPLPVDEEKLDKDETESYTDDFSDDKSEVHVNQDENKVIKEPESIINFSSSTPIVMEKNYDSIHLELPKSDELNIVTKEDTESEVHVLSEKITAYKEDVEKKEDIIKMLIEDNRKLKDNIKALKVQLEETTELLETTRASMKTQNLKSPEINLELEKTLEELKDAQEINTALQLQLDNINKTFQELKLSHEDVSNSNRNLERRLIDTESLLSKYKNELINLKEQNVKLTESETNLSKLLEIEKLQTKNLKIQTEKDAKCILDLNRQIKEMERIIARKHPDSVSALIVASKNDPSDSNLSARRVLEDRIKNLEQEAAVRDTQSSKIFLEVQEKFNQMKNKYESHIEDLELHVNDLKDQLKKKADTYDVYTQTFFDEQKIPEKETTNKACQANFVKTELKTKPITKKVERIEKEETHLLATIRGLQTDLANKEKVAGKLQREIEEIRKTNRRLQKEREGSLRCLSDKREIRSYPEKLAQQVSIEIGDADEKLIEELKAVKNERDKMKLQLCRIENDYQQLKTKRLHDLTALQEAHEREIGTYLTNITPLREQLEIQQVTITNLQTQLSQTKEDLAIAIVEKDHLNSKLKCGAGLISLDPVLNTNTDDETVTLKRKIAYLESQHEEREQRLRAIVHGLAQKNVTNRSCEQCAARQQQLIGYKAELDQLLATLRSLQ